MSDSPPSSLLPYIVSGQRVGVGCGKVLIPNPENTGKGRIESTSSNSVLSHHEARLCAANHVSQAISLFSGTPDLGPYLINSG
jgi:hypothetical protein